ncbi:valine--tRNA ligase [bacterium]|nr:valine--tRNA ligase [bacterium]|tara:strand:- start:2432 stop:5020 length:2589 start_codon:yes stop_codon:yes gene_type:complete
MDTVYDPKSFESDIYCQWESGGYFSPDFFPEGRPVFSMVIPPPNVTGKLHMGHALNHTIQDILARWKRLTGHRVLWIPGTDHAGIATQAVVEKQCVKDNTSRHALGRAAFVQRIWDWKAQYGSHIENQIRRLGDSVDWSRQRFTLDESLAKAVRHHFVELYNQGHIYRGWSITHWCIQCQSAISDIEVNHIDHAGSLWHLRYTLVSGTDAIVVATTRPETLLGDQAIAVHPKDNRYAQWIGSYVEVPLCGRTIPIVADDAVDPEFGTGAVKVTPAHDHTDYEIGQRHNLEPRVIMDENGCLSGDIPLRYHGLSREDARSKIINDLGDCLVQTTEHTVPQARCYRCDTVVEPRLSKQWFVAMKELVQPAIQAVHAGDVQFHPQRWESLYMNWMNTIRDWCISRQIWWGHRIPVWYDPEDPETPIVCVNDPEDPRLIQDPDVLDTWFSSAIWPFSTMGWPEKTTDFDQFYPTQALVTGYDIITFWVSRMMTMGIHQCKTPPFSTVIVHGLVRDITGKKMSKSLGNVIDPIEIMDTYGADALRFCLASHATVGGQDIRFSVEKVEACRNFANKLWNATRYLLQQPVNQVTNKQPLVHRDEDRWIISQWYTTLDAVNQGMEQNNVALVTETLWQFTWNNVCDWYIEMTKSRADDAAPVLGWVLSQLFIVLHPFMPFITERLWAELQAHGAQLSDKVIVAQWPMLDQSAINSELNNTIDSVVSIIRTVRSLRKQLQLKNKTQCPLYVSGEGGEMLTKYSLFFQELAGVSALHSGGCSGPHIPAVVSGYTLGIPITEATDITGHQKRLEQQANHTKQSLDQVNKKLNNPGFLNKAPERVVEDIRIKKEALQCDYDQLMVQMKALSHNV